MLNTILYSLLGYLSGSILSSQAAGALFHSDDITINSIDHNPGVYNAFKNGGFWFGLFVLAGDLLKGFLPVFLYLHLVPFSLHAEGLCFVLAAPVLGTLLPVWRKGNGGIGITVSFGVLLALIPNWLPVLALAVSFVLFSCVLVINPHYYRTLFSFIVFACLVLVLPVAVNVSMGCMIISLSVIINLVMRKSTFSEFTIEPVWKR